MGKMKRNFSLFFENVCLNLFCFQLLLLLFQRSHVSQQTNFQ
ncbi:hypothetical protein HMPREF3038_02902 [Akkermansia sp. KLE1797]|nr:hypothetical protein HMPREF3038_02902 [Akkermansia sp. KLE1797]KXU52629.1 hypothetical protein HMPREF3039_03153 [Akkermansia sp. KLE1798]KZA04059.1 hypothetical protein HMPREF1326_02256 [Akkermansia sp. KLE1605]